ATLLMLIWGATPVHASVYQVGINVIPQENMRYICEDANDLKNGYYAISTATELQTFAGIVNKTVAPSVVTVILDTGDAVATPPVPASLSTNAKLTGDIDLSSVCSATSGDSWTPIGINVEPYKGVFDGQGYTVKNLDISASTNYQGLFGSVTAGTVKNLTVAGSITAVNSIDIVGGIAGVIFTPATIENCCSQVAISGSLSSAGGIVGLSNGGTIKNCRNEGLIDGTSGDTVGGIAGWLGNSSVIDCENCAPVTGSKNLGGVAGYCSSMSSITNTFNTGTVTAINEGVGGICANLEYAANIANCYNTGALNEGGSSAESYAGGIVGSARNDDIYSTSTVIKNCYNTGSIQANKGGFSTPEVSAGTVVGKIDSLSFGTVNVSSCYWLGSLTLTNHGVSVNKNAVGGSYSSPPTSVTACGFFTAEQGQAVINTTGSGLGLGTTGTYALADALNIGATGNSTWKVDAAKNSGYPVFDSGGYTVVSAPPINTQPTDQSAFDGENFTLNLTATGVTGYQWYQLEMNSATLGGTAISTAAVDNASMVSQSVPGSYYYYCLVTATNASGITATTRSNTVTVTVTDKPEASWVLTTGGTTDSGTLAEAIAACNNNTTGGTITLNKNLTLTDPITISKAVTLLSDGNNKITRGSGLAGSDMVTVTNEGNLTLGTIGGTDANTLTLDGGAVWTGTVDPILGRGTNYTEISTTRSIVNNQGTFNMHSGVIIQNNAYGGVYSDLIVAVYNHPAAVDKTATFNMDGGSITGNYGCEAGAIYNYGFPSAVDKTILNISGGRIDGNQNTPDVSSGTGGIKNYGTLILSDTAVIAGNKGTYSGGVDAGWKMTMTGGTITGNQGNYCGGIGQSYSIVSQLSLAGGTVTGNNATGSNTDGNTAGGLLPSKVSESTFNISGNPVVTGNTVGGTISQSGGVYTATGGTPVNMGLMYTTDFKTPVAVNGTLTNGADIGVSLLTFSGSDNVVPTPGIPVIVAVLGAPVMDASSYLAYFSSDNSSYNIAKDGNNLVLKVRTPVDISGSITGRAYNGQPIALDAAPVIKKAGTSDAVAIANLTYLYTSTDGKGYSNAVAPKNAGAYQLVISVPIGNLDYTGSSTAIPFSISQQPVTVTAQSDTINVGAEAPVYQFNADGLVSGEFLTNVVFNCTYLKNDSTKGITGTYPIVPSGGTISDNYLLSYTPGTLTVNANSSGGGGGGYTPPATPVMPGITVNPGTITFDPSGNLAVDITGAPAGSVIYYSLDGITFTTTPPAMENAGEHKVYLKITCPGYQDYTTQTTVLVEKHEAPVIPELSLPVTGGQQSGSTDLGTLLPANRGETHFRLGPFSDPRGILSGPPTIDQLGHLTYGFLNPLSASGEQVTASAETTALTATITVLVSMENYADTTINVVIGDSPAAAIGVQYQTHVQDYGWENDWTTDGNLSGTYGQSKRLEALKVELTGDVPAGATIDTEVHVQNQGNLGPFAMGTEAGTTGLGLRLENICLTLKNLPGYTLLYNVHVQNQGWLRDENDSSSWFKSGETAGTSALSLRLEGIRIKLVKSE
ncbi:MAG: hypothetical protein L6276_05335, partial [Acetobacterium sp.]|nr:hypothetical protein [Bacillota bacterium]MCG2729692.1 hypothetical protein [Acetobacterium sp.]